jgi:hypothetical protein
MIQVFIAGALTGMPMKLGLIVAAFCLAAGYAVVTRHPSRLISILLNAGSALVAFLAVASFLAVGGRPWQPSFLNKHDTYHYYFGAKYSAELGYDRLYHCTLIALDELSPRYHKGVLTLRSMSHYRHVDKSWYLERPDICKTRFSTERWERFKEDVFAYQRNYRPRWKAYLSDKGYNPTPAWTLLGRFVAERVPLQPWQVFNWVGILDLLLLLGAFVLAFAAFGWPVAVVALVFLCACFPLTLTFIRGSLLRLDWLAAMVAGVAMLAWKRYALCGVFLGYATMMRVFPVLFLFGPIVLGIASLVRHRRVPKHTLALVLGFTLSCGALFGASVALTGHRDGWQSWVSKISLHNADISTMRLGLGPLLMYRGETQELDIRGPDGKGTFRGFFVPHKQAVVATMRPAHIGIALLVLGMLAAGLVRKPHSDLEAFGLSYAAVFVLVSPTFYYYCLLTPAVLALAARSSHQRKLLLPLGMLCAAELANHVLHASFRFEYGRYSLMSIGLAAASLAALVAVLVTPRTKNLGK